MQGVIACTQHLVAAEHLGWTSTEAGQRLPCANRLHDAPWQRLCIAGRVRFEPTPSYFRKLLLRRINGILWYATPARMPPAEFDSALSGLNPGALTFAPRRQSKLVCFYAKGTTHFFQTPYLLFAVPSLVRQTIRVIRREVTLS